MDMTETSKPKRLPVPTYDPGYVRAVSTAAYRSRFSEFDRERILADPKRGEDFFVKNSAAFDAITRSVLDAVNGLGLRKRSVRNGIG